MRYIRKGLRIAEEVAQKDAAQIDSEPVEAEKLP
jgi:hypothetical protein